MIKISLEKIFHRGSSRIKINAPYDDGLIAFLKTLPTRKFSATLKCWYIDYSGKALSAFYKLDSNKYLVDAKGMVSQNINIAKEKERVFIYCNNSQNQFTLLESTIKKEFELIKESNDCIIIKNTEESYARLLETLDKLLFVPKEIKRRKNTSGTIISKAEIKRLLDEVNNEKQQLMLTFMYACGLRRNELTAIKLDDLKLEEKCLNVHAQRENVHRIIPLGNKMLGMIQKYIVAYKPKQYLFEQKSGDKYDPQIISRLFKKALRNANLSEKYSVHSLRQSFAVHMQQVGYDLSYIQNLLGHTSSKTTSIYTHQTKKPTIVEDPFEALF